MATISTFVKSVSGGQRFFTAPFDCIVGISIVSGTGAGSGNEGGGALYKALSGQSAIDDYNLLVPENAVPGTKISSIIMKQGDSFVFRYNFSYVKLYITGVSA